MEPLHLNIPIDLSDAKMCKLDCNIAVVCPKCKQSVVHDGIGGGTRLEYPKKGEKIVLPVYCEDCDDWVETEAVVKGASISLCFEDGANGFMFSGKSNGS